MGIVTAFLFLFNINSFPQYGIGDCLVHTKENKRKEFLKEDIRIAKILNVGKRNYLYQFDRNPRLIIESEISYIDEFYSKVKCEAIGL